MASTAAPVTLWFFSDEEPGEEPEFVKEGEFPSLAAALDRAENIGSRWFFYPHFLITDAEGSELLTQYAEP
jgi:hypothetical protein